MFGKSSDTPKRKKSGFGIVRLFMSLLVLGILGIGLFQAFRSFSGFDPLSLNLKTLPKNIMSSESVYKIVNSILSFSPEQPKINTTKVAATPSSQPKASGTLKFKFAIVADSHIDMNNLSKALNQAKTEGAAFIIGMGDLSDVGTVEELENSKKQYDAVGIPFYMAAGDHDLWDARNKKINPNTNFIKTFGTPYQSFSYQNVRFLVIYNSDDYTGVDDLQMQWVESELERITSQHPQLLFAIVPTPLYHPSSDHIMGKVNADLKKQSTILLNLFKKYQVNEVFSADTHFFSHYSEPSTDQKMTTVGAVTSDRNPQSPRFAIVDVFDNGGYNVEETEVK